MLSSITIAIAKKEFRHILRDPQALALIFFLPVLMLFLFGYAITMEMRNVATAIDDRAHSQESRRLIEQIKAGGFFQVTQYLDVNTDTNSLFKKGKVKLVLQIPVALNSPLPQKTIAIQALIDATDPNIASNIQNYLEQVFLQYNQTAGQFRPPLQVESRLLYNEAQKSSFFFVPGLVAVIMLLLSCLLASLAIVREKELGSLEQILVSSLKPAELILGKIIPYVLLAFLAGLLIIVLAVFWFGVPIQGSLWLLFGAMLLYIVCGISLGILISTIARTQQVAMIIILLATILPTILLSGFIFPIESMPQILAWLTQVIPATHFLKIIRGIMLKGNHFTELVNPFVALFVIAGFLNLISLKRLKKTWE